MNWWKVFLLCAVLISFFAPGPALSAEKGERQIISAKSEADYDHLKAHFTAGGGTIVREMKQVLSFVGIAPVEIHERSAALAAAKSQGLYQVGSDQIRYLIRPSQKKDMLGTAGLTMGMPFKPPFPSPTFTADPAFGLNGLMWNYFRIEADDAWKMTRGSPAVRVGVADTGLDYTHSELSGKVTQTVPLTDPTLCKTYFGNSDADLAALYGGPVNTDWNGHGTWIGGNIAAVVDHYGINGIAPDVGLVSLKISEWCGYAYDSSIIKAFLYAADYGIDVVSISFGGYDDLTKPDQAATYQLYKDAVRHAWNKGTVIVAAAGNDHVRIDDEGKVVSHGILTTPGSAAADFFGLYETPGGVPGVVMVSSTGNRVELPSDSCAAGTTGTTAATCKPKSDLHQPIGAGWPDQLAYYSNYGPRIDIAAPGGARKFNLPVWDRGGTPGYPVTATDGYKAWEDFGITSNWATQIPCYVNLGSPIFLNNQCYSIIQGTSMATPHVSAVMALVASYNAAARWNPEKLVDIVKESARKLMWNLTPPLSAKDKSAGDQNGVACTTGYCHLGGLPIANWEAYGAGIVDAKAALQRR